MAVLRILAALGVTLVVASCGGSKFQRYDGPPVTQVVVQKEARRMYLVSNQDVLKTYDIGLGFRPVGDKKVQGDGKTPEGAYWIDRRNPNSEFHLSLGISYPNPVDVAEAQALGQSPGGDIFIHGRPRKYRKGGQDWTAGCIAVTDREIQEIYAMVKDGTPIFINP